MSDASNLPVELDAEKIPSTVRRQVVAENQVLPSQGIQPSLDELRLSLSLGVKPTFSRRARLVAKRLIDIVVSAVALVALAPFFLILSAVIRIGSPGPAIFRQVRWGKNNTKIRIYKFRTMFDHLSDASGVQQTTDDDPRTTALGSFLRKNNIDELPQLLNVLMGEMSLIGPRCHAINMLAADELYEDLVPGYELRHLIRPGITGLAQCNGFRGPTTDRDLSIERVHMDLLYVRDFNLMLDFKIAWKTTVNEFKGGSGS